MMYLTICDRWERIASTTSEVERGFSGAMVAYPTFWGISKDNLAPSHKQELPASSDSRMPDGSNAECRYIIYRTHIIICATARSLPNRFQGVAGRCFQAIPTHSFCGFRACYKLIQPVSHFATDKHRLAVFDSRHLQKGAAILVQRQLALSAAYSAWGAGDVSGCPQTSVAFSISSLSPSGRI